jgi:hypothetical protein
MAKDGKDSETGEPRAEPYDEELLSANWNPVLALLEWSCARTAADAGRSDRPDIREEDADDFLGRIYSSGS